MRSIPIVMTVLALCSPLLGFGQVADASQLHGTWQVNYENTIAHLTANEQNRYDSLSTWIKDQIHDNLINRRLSLSASEFTLAGANNHLLEGAWSFDVASQRLLFDPTQGETIEIKVHSLSAGELVLQMADPANEQVLVHYWYMDAVTD